jgi:hypothetical protein
MTESACDESRRYSSVRSEIVKEKTTRAFLAGLLVASAAVSVGRRSSASSAQSATKVQLWDYKGVNVKEWMMGQPGDGLGPAKPDEAEAKLATRVTDEFNKLGLTDGSTSGTSV